MIARALLARELGKSCEMVGTCRMSNGRPTHQWMARHRTFCETTTEFCERIEMTTLRRYGCLHAIGRRAMRWTGGVPAGSSSSSPICRIN